MPARVTRASKATREKIIKAASRAFARNGYDGASIRTIVAAADVNQAAINYHFGSKDGLYRAVLQAALLALMNDDGAREGDGDLSREAALRRFLRQQLRPMISGDELSAYVRIFSWETLKPSPVFRKFMAREAAPVLCHRHRAGSPLPAGGRERQAGGRRRALAVRAMQHLRAQRPAALPPAVPPHARRALRGLARGYDGGMGRGRARTAAGAGKKLGLFCWAASVTFPPICHAWLLLSP